MCGICAVLCKPGALKPPSLEDLLDHIGGLFQYSGKQGSREDAQVSMQKVREQTSLWVRPEGFLALFADQQAAVRIEDGIDRLEAWRRRLENFLDNAAKISQEERERIHELIIAARDTVWQLREDLLGNIPRVEALMPGKDRSKDSAWHHAWALNLILNNIDRLEVRGRDSAGVAAYIRFPSAKARTAFLSKGGRKKELKERSANPAFSHLSAVAPPDASDTLLFAFKVAEEVGEMGQNVRFLRESISRDALFQAALQEPGIGMQAMGHTRWASNGVISLPNTHPVDSTRLAAAKIAEGSQGALVAALNGDIDNFQELFKKYVEARDFTVDPGITTDAKIIPLVVDAHLKETGNLEEAFARAFDEFEGSMAICLMAADRPGEFICAQKGSGQGMFLGLAGDTQCVASEMYGLVELTPYYMKARGERAENGRTLGETFLLRNLDRGGVQLLPGNEPIDKDRILTAEITTRDINRGRFPRFLLKEISESVLSVEKTIRGKVRFDKNEKDAHTLLDETVLPKALIEKMKAGKIRRIIPTGQGTAAVAAQGIAHLLEVNLKAANIEVSPMKATELSGHYLHDDMSDCLVVAVSQSGTTTDTNRTVDLVKERGAFVVGIVNRRNSDLVYKSHGVLYTSDGRDIEMSVASTKAFYAQNVAGEILALALAEALGLLAPKERVRKLKLLLELPKVMERVLRLSSRIEEIANETALRRRYWAVVGTGASKIAADEIRIKLSELCYKAIAVDYLEDKKHIDLSSEPMILVCASGLPASSVSDVVKEVAIFKAHQSLPIVVADEKEKRFDPYAAYLIQVPKYDGELSYLLPTMVGHLFGYYAASVFDGNADRMKRLRTSLVREMERGDGELMGTELWKMLGRNNEITSGALEVQTIMDSGELNSGLEVGTATKLSSLLDFLLGLVPLDAFPLRFKQPGTVGNLLASLVSHLSEAINELCRPIDAIKHQAKTVTVGISRQVEKVVEGALWSFIRELDLDASHIAASHANTLSALEPLVAEVEGVTLYKVEGLTPMGKPLYASTICVEQKINCSLEITSRCETPKRLAGTKWGVVADGKVFLGKGLKDDRRILIVPLVGQRAMGRLILFHLALEKKGDLAQRDAALKSMPDRYKQILIAYTEATHKEWDPALLEKADNEQLFFADPRKFVKTIQ
ncbi:MAG: SIS domain-containing protein [Planctomycetota bacterium]|jgi:glucosamine--fructose-6-phosphate aminotransferase (isomerizing)